MDSHGGFAAFQLGNRDVKLPVPVPGRVDAKHSTGGALAVKRRKILRVGNGDAGGERKP